LKVVSIRQIEEEYVVCTLLSMGQRYRQVGK